jgi:class 3 adenylate cyclase
MALHTGETIERDGNYFGPPLNRAARLLGVAHGGQILCSEVTARLVGDRVGMRDLGLVRLKDLLQPERVYQPVVEGLADDFPALSSLDTARHNLPTQRTADRSDAEVQR